MKPARAASTAYIALLCLGATATACADDSATVEHYEGQAYAARSGDAVYRESHWLYRQDGQRHRLVLYRCSDGTPFGRKQISEGNSALAPDFDFVDARDGYREGVRSSGEGRQVYWQAATGKPARQEAVALGPQAVADAGFDALVRQRWNELAAGEAVHAAFLVPADFNFLPLVLRKDNSASDAQFSAFRLRLQAWYAFALPEFVLVYRNSDQRLQRFQGISTIRDSQGRRQNVRIEFGEAQNPLPASRADVDAAAAEPLTNRCRS